MIIDLSVQLNENTPVYPGDPKPKIETAGILNNDGFCDHLISLGTHIGTHIDAPMHMIEGGVSLDGIPIDQFVGRGKLVELENESFDSVKSANIEAGDIVLFRTGMSKSYKDSVYFEEYPVMTEEVANYLVEVGVKMIGLDACSVDIADGFPVHKILLGGNVLIIENLTNLEQLTDKEFRVIALPLNLQIDGSPARVIAEVL